ncbi:cell wall-binding repeat-containing protein [Paeniglutamicibacter sp. ABSL32-1]|uniref:cell wall-binding repeat-containing protein n=1 Tax=Paeniglutamicibacter quisquiliarum TaxID=2849498 RepID=UPI001C2CCDE5|nr:cell wall-binding repeat-containing protein [Paeniglutamicibacter quisquiliarum]MBV1780795.1 cell wall-binding repeat-containing protein [Paeniglutamicibacter quisquiliarum]
MPEFRSSLPRLFALSLAAALVVPLAVAGPAAATPVPDTEAGTTTSKAPGQKPPPESGAATLLESALKPATKDLDVPDVNPGAAAVAAKDIRTELKSAAKLTAPERVELSEQALTAVGIQALDAQLGQGQRRIEESGDPKAPTLAELESLAAATEELAATSPEQLDAPGTETEPSSETSPTASGAALERGGAFPAGISTTGAAFEATPAGVSVPASREDLRTWRPPGVLGVDVSHHQGDVDWAHAWGKGARFAYIKATQSWPTTLFKDPKFAQNYTGSANQGLMRGAYHFAMPAHSSGAAQAKQFLANGGGWTADEKTLPPLLDIEWNPYTATAYSAGKGNVCYGMTPAQLVTWISDFGNTVKAATGRLPMIYTAQSWWDKCTGDSTAFKGWPLHVSVFPTAEVPKNPRELPEGWTTFNIWQYASNADLIGPDKDVDANVWNGDLTSLRDFARNRRSTPYRLLTSYLGNYVPPTRLAPVRLYGATLYDTPVAISRRTFPSTTSTVVVASGENFPDALAGSPLATLKKAPLLLIKKGSIPSSVAAELQRLNPQNILVLGGPIAISDATVTKLKAYGPVTRVWGNSLYDTSSKIAANWSSAPAVFLATGQRFEDAMSLAAVAAGRRAPMLLTAQSAVPATTLASLKRLNPARVYLAGGPLAISAEAEAQVRRAVPNATVIRYGGRTLYDTSALIAKAFWSRGSQRQFIATGARFPDGLTGAVAAGYNGAPLLLAQKTCLPSSVSNALVSMKGWTNVLLGGPLVLDSTVAYRADGTPNVC